MNKRILEIRKLLDEKNFDSILIKSKTNKKYINALTGSGVKVLITKNEVYEIMDGRYINEAKSYKNDFIIVEHSQGNDYIKEINKIIKDQGLKNIAVEGNQILASEYIRMKDLGFDVKLLKDELEYIRRIKDENEISLVRKACEITDYIFNEAIKDIKIGMKEYELSAYIQYLALKNGASAMAFDTIIASGVRGAMPHGRPSNKQFQYGEAITIDFGIVYDGYQSDMTRTVFIGEPHGEIKKIYDIVKSAQEIGVKSIKRGIMAKEVDAIVRNYIEEQGYGKYFTHGLGHGMGIGEGEFPVLNAKSETILQDGMIMSCEPGIYVPNIGGVRIEDDVVIENGIGVPLNKTTKDYLVIEGK